MTIAIKILCRKLISSKLEKTHSDTDIRDWLFPTWETDFTEEVFFCSGKSVSKGGLYPPRVGLAASSEARAVIETQGGYRPPEDTLLPEQKNTSEVTSGSHLGDSFLTF